MPLLSPAVRVAWCAYTRPLEGAVLWPYLDTHAPPLVTVGYGCALLSFGAFQICPWLTGSGELASSAEVLQAWATLTAMPGGLVASRYAYPGHLRLSQEDAEQTALARLDADVRVLAAYWPAWSSWPAEAQAALLSLAWAVGAGGVEAGLTGPRWPHLHAAVAAQDWRAAAAAGQLRWQDNPGVRPRDLTVETLFLLAAGVDPAEASATWPLGPSAVAAGKAMAPLLEAIAADLS